MGSPPLKKMIMQDLTKKGLDVTDLEIMITSGANQAFTNIALALCDASDTAGAIAHVFCIHWSHFTNSNYYCNANTFLAYLLTVIIAPYYFSHKLALQLCNAKVIVCPFEQATLYPDWAALQDIITQQQPKMVNYATTSLIRATYD